MGCEVVGVSVDSTHSHRAYSNMERKKGGLGQLDIPLIGDITKKMATDFDCLLPEGVALRATFIIDDKGILRHKSINDLPVGRNVDEVVRLVDAFKYTDIHGEVCPAKWTKKGDSTMHGGNTRKTEEYFEKGHAN